MTETQRILLGYAVNFVYIALLIVFGELAHSKWGMNKETARKLEHIGTSGNWLLAYLIMGASYHLIILNGFAAVLLTVIALTGVMKSVERDDAEKSYGLIWFGWSTFAVALLCYLFNKELFVYTGIAYYSLALGDGFAPLVARAFKKNNPVIHGKKTLWGMITVYAVTVLVAILFKYVFQLDKLNWLYIISVGGLACNAELFGENGFDNLTVEFSVFAYTMLAHFGLTTPALAIMLAVAPLINIGLARADALTEPAAVISYVYLLLTTFFVGYAGLVTIVALFIIAAIVSKITTKKFNELHQLEKAHTPRGFWQIFANSVVALLFALLFYITKNQIFLYLVFTALAEEFADSMASDIGRLSTKQPLDVLRFKPIEAGLSGGVSFLGLGAALIGAAIASAIPFLFLEFSLHAYLVIFLVAFVGTIIDSILGSGIQVLYRCPVCETNTEKRTHCDVPTEYVKGLPFINNSTVNFLSSACSALIGLLVFLIF